MLIKFPQKVKTNHQKHLAYRMAMQILIVTLSYHNLTGAFLQGYTVPPTWKPYFTCLL